MKTLDEKIIAHRGESYDAPENTLASVNLAWERGARAVEIDVHLSKDRQIVVMHDDNTRRTALRNKRVKDQTLCEIKELDAGKFKHSKWQGETIPTLSEVMNTIPANGKLIVEIKCGSDIIQVLQDVIEKSNLEEGQIEIIAFDFKTLVEAKKVLTGHKMLWLLEFEDEPNRHHAPPGVQDIVKKIGGGNLDGINIRADNRINESFVDCIRSANLQLYIWTINSPAEAIRYIQMGVDGIATDRAEWLKFQLMNGHWCI